MAAAIDGGSGSTDEEEEGGGNTVFDGISLTFSADSASTVEAFEGSLSQVIADTTDGAADGNFVVEYTKTPDSKNYAGVIVGNLAGNLVDDIPFDIGAVPLQLRHAFTLQKQARLFVCRLLIALLKVPMQTMLHAGSNACERRLE